MIEGHIDSSFTTEQRDLFASGIVAEIGVNAYAVWSAIKFFADYTASLDALVAGKVDVNSQTLNDTIFGVGSGSEQKIIVAGDNSTGNDGGRRAIRRHAPQATVLLANAETGV